MVVTFKIEQENLSDRAVTMIGPKLTRVKRFVATNANPASIQAVDWVGEQISIMSEIIDFAGLPPATYVINGKTHVSR